MPIITGSIASPISVTMPPAAPRGANAPTGSLPVQVENAAAAPLLDRPAVASPGHDCWRKLDQKGSNALSKGPLQRTQWLKDFQTLAEAPGSPAPDDRVLSTLLRVARVDASDDAVTRVDTYLPRLAQTTAVFTSNNTLAWLASRGDLQALQQHWDEAIARGCCNDHSLRSVLSGLRDCLARHHTADQAKQVLELARARYDAGSEKLHDAAAASCLMLLAGQAGKPREAWRVFLALPIETRDIGVYTSLLHACDQPADDRPERYAVSPSAMADLLSAVEESKLKPDGKLALAVADALHVRDPELGTGIIVVASGLDDPSLKLSASLEGDVVEALHTAFGPQKDAATGPGPALLDPHAAWDKRKQIINLLQAPVRTSTSPSLSVPALLADPSSASVQNRPLQALSLLSFYVSHEAFDPQRSQFLVGGTQDEVHATKLLAQLKTDGLDYRFQPIPGTALGRLVPAALLENAAVAADPMHKLFKPSTR